MPPIQIYLITRGCTQEHSDDTLHGFMWMLEQLRWCWFLLSNLCDVLLQIQEERKSFALVMGILTLFYSRLWGAPSVGLQ